MSNTSASATATPGGHSQFDVIVDGALIFSKHDKGRFPEDGEILRLLSPKS